MQLLPFATSLAVVSRREVQVGGNAACSVTQGKGQQLPEVGVDGEKSFVEEGGGN